MHLNVSIIRTATVSTVHTKIVSSRARPEIVLKFGPAELFVGPKLGKRRFMPGSVRTIKGVVSCLSGRMPVSINA